MASDFPFRCSQNPNPEAITEMKRILRLHLQKTAE